MKQFSVELKRTSYITIYIEAETEDQAEALAWDEIQTDGSYGINDGEWNLESIEEA